VWILEDYDTDNWNLKHVVDTEELFGCMNIKVGSKLCDEEYRVITVHPEWNFIFLVGKDRTLIAYDMDRKRFMSSMPVSSAFVYQEGISI
jgi:hypothetical protein